MEGKWIMTVHTYMGDMRSFCEYKVDGEVLTGTVEDAANGAVANIENGTLKDGVYSYDGEKLVGKSANPMGEFDADAVRA